MEEVGANELSFTPVGSWVVERGLFRFLSVYFRSPWSFFFLLFVSFSFFPTLLPSPLSQPFSLCFSTLFSLHLLSRFCPVLYSVFATLLFRYFVSAAAFLFFLFRPVYCSPRLFPLRPLRPLFRSLHARVFPASPALRSDRLAYPLRNRSTETCSGVAGTNEKATEGNWSGTKRMRPERFEGTPQEREIQRLPEHIAALKLVRFS